jgi:4-hydroxymandelate oxidase
MHHRAPIQSKLDIDALEATARAKLPRMVYDYYAGGADDELTLADNRAAWDRYALLPRVLVDVSERELSTSVLGRTLAVPFAVAPMAYQGLAHPEGELATVRAAGAVGAPLILSTFATRGIEEVMAVATGPVWFQLYAFSDRGATRALVERAAAAGASALVVTVDAPLLGNRRRDTANDFSLPGDLGVGNLDGLEVPGGSAGVSGASLAAYFGQRVGRSLTWDDVDWIGSIAGLPLVLKGILAAEDARLAAAHGAAAIVVSNHGGRQLDGVPAAVDVLAELVDACAGAVEVWVDGGVRRGTDLVKALALGARLVLVGRPVLWGLATDGETGVRHVLEGLRDELDLALALCGCRRPADLGRGHVRPAAGSGMR